MNRRWLAVSFYTKGTGYEKEIDIMRDSLDRFDIDHHILGYPPLGTWRANLNYKSSIIRHSLDDFPMRDVVFLDADAIVRKDPVLFDTLSESGESDIAIFRLARRGIEPNELVSSTIWIKNNEIARAIVGRWHELAIRNPNVRHQKCLDVALTEFSKIESPPRVFLLPFAYACIFDHPTRGGCEAVIEQFQASRRLRKSVGYGTGFNRTIK